MTYTQTLLQLRTDLIDSLSSVDAQSGFLPHIVFVEEESKNESGYSDFVYKHYMLEDINPDGTCVLADPRSGEKQNRNLHEINIEWLLTVWNWYDQLNKTGEI